MNHIKDINQEEKMILTASSRDNLSIELVECIGQKTASEIINISEDLKKIYGPSSILSNNNINKYFNDNTLPFVARYKGEIIGY